ncbi:MAG: hypothetical protein IT208_04995 [Chthonomonadales bacterium]|nr:hypothetical protein [Chthonomonadales bacterium]
MRRLKLSLLAAVGLLALAGAISAVGPKRVMAIAGYTPVRSIDEPALNPRQQLTPYTVANSITTDVSLAPVPASVRRRVIEHFSATAGVPSGQSGFFFITTTANASTAVHVVPVTQRFADAAFPGSDTLVASEETRLYADPGTTPRIAFRRSSSAGSASFQAAVSGHDVAP